jgi:MFS family permease
VRGLLSSLAVLQNRPFRLLFTARLVSEAGEALVPVALAFAVLDLTGSAADLGLVFAAFMGARVVFIVVGGVWADRLPRQLVMIAADLVRAAAQGFLALAFFTDAVTLWQIVVAAFVVGAGSAFFGPASTGLMKQIVPPGELQEANALLGVGGNAINIIGPLVAGVLVTVVDFGVIFAIDAASYVLGVFFLLAMRLPKTVERPERQSFLADVRRGVHEVRSRRWLWTSFICFALSNVTIAFYFVLGPLVVLNEAGGARDWGLMLAGGAIGGLFGSAVALRWKPARPLIPSFLLILLVSLQLLALVPPLPVLLLIVAAGAAVAAIAIANALWDTMLQQHIPEAAISRVSALDWMISLVFMPLGYVLAGPAAETFGLDTTLIVAAIFGTVANVGVLFVPDVRNLRRVEDEAPELHDASAAIPIVAP